MTILIIEDDSGLTELMKEKVEDCGAEMICVSTSPTTASWMKGCISSRSPSPEEIWPPKCGRRWIRNRCIAERKTGG